MPRKVKTKEEKRTAKVDKIREGLIDQLAQIRSLKTYREVADYLELVLNSQRLGVMGKDTANSAAYIGGVLLQAIRLARLEEGAGGGVLTATFQREQVSMSMTPEQARQIVMAGNMSTQIQLLKRLEDQGQVHDAEVVEQKQRSEAVTPGEKYITNIIRQADKLEQDDSFFGE